MLGDGSTAWRRAPLRTPAHSGGTAPPTGLPEGELWPPLLFLRLPPGVAPPLIKQQRWPRQPHRVLEPLLIGVLSSLRPTGPVVTHVREPGREARPDLRRDTARSCPRRCLSAGPAAPPHSVSPGSPPAAVAAPSRSAPTAQAPRLHLPPHSLPPAGQLVTALLWETTFPGSDAAALSASALPSGKPCPPFQCPPPP